MNLNDKATTNRYTIKVRGLEERFLDDCREVVTRAAKRLILKIKRRLWVCRGQYCAGK